MSKESKMVTHPDDCQCGNHEAHNIKFDKPKTAEQINEDKLLLWINRYLTRRFIADPAMLPEDECEKEAKVILDKCREQIRQQLIEEIIQHVKKEYVPCKDADIFIKDLMNFSKK